MFPLHDNYFKDRDSDVSQRATKEKFLGALINGSIIYININYYEHAEVIFMYIKNFFEKLGMIFL